MGATIAEFLSRQKEALDLEVLNPEVPLDREITLPEIASPGLVLAGYTERFVSKRLHTLGETEVSYLNSLDSDQRSRSLETLLGYDIPAVFIPKNLDPPDQMLEIAAKKRVPVIRSGLSTAEFYHRITPILEEMFAPSTNIHGSLADVFGVGLLFVGRSGIGKSECVLDLVERGHRLVADDSVRVSKRGTEVLIGRSSERTYRMMEIRGAGLVDVSALFGVRAVRQQKRIEVIVQLIDWDAANDVDRTGLDRRTRSILGVDVPEVTVPLNPGKNITVVSEVVAMNHLLLYSGQDSAKLFNDRLVKEMSSDKRLRNYLAEDFE